MRIAHVAVTFVTDGPESGRSVTNVRGVVPVMYLRIGPVRQIVERIFPTESLAS
jgi:hypothetical protein